MGRAPQASYVLESTILLGHTGRCTADRAGYPTHTIYSGQYSKNGELRCGPHQICWGDFAQ